MPKTISMRLSAESIRNAVKELQEYKDWVSRKTDELRNQVAKRIAEEAQAGFNISPISVDAIDDSYRTASVNVRIDDQGHVTVIIADGEDAVWAEFGAGVWFNGQAHSSPHPKGEELHLTIGDYGKGKGQYDMWSYYDGERHFTMGTPSSMPFYKAYMNVLNDLPNIAKGVFTSD